MRPRWFLLALAAVPVVLTPTAAQPPVTPTDGKWVVHMTVDPTPAPRPALKYMLLPEVRDLHQGNQVQAFYKCSMEQNNLFYSKEAVDEREKWLYAPLAELAKEKRLVEYGGSAVRQAHHAARLDTVDWQITTQMKAEGIYLLLPDLQPLRTLASILKVRLRGEIARGEFDNAIRTAQTMLALARTLNDHPTLIGNLVGLAITSLTFDAIEELVQQPGAPNLFWALADLPQPFFDLRRGGQGERTWLPKEFDALRKAEPISETELAKLCETLEPIYRLGAENNAKKGKVWLNYAAMAADAAKAKAARERLVDLGHKADAVGRLPAVQVVMMDDLASYEIARDDFLKWASYPYHMIPAEVLTAKNPDGIFTGLIPAMAKVKQQQARVQQRIDMLQAAEAVRAHAAANGRKFPATLAEVKLPIRVDVFSGKPFVYEVKDGKAVLRGTPPAERAKEPVFNRVYEITLAK